MAVLDTMIQPQAGEQDTYIVYYHILDGDQHGCAPDHPKFDGTSKSCLHKIAEINDKVVINNNYTYSAVWLTSYNHSRRWYIMKLFDY